MYAFISIISTLTRSRISQVNPNYHPSITKIQTTPKAFSPPKSQLSSAESPSSTSNSRDSKRPHCQQPNPLNPKKPRALTTRATQNQTNGSQPQNTESGERPVLHENHKGTGTHSPSTKATSHKTNSCTMHIYRA